ncbi:non-ribosomal peptide synthase [Burkholderia pseudomallei]|nr:non-ribosomal peptide synthase [Burkholderia pseudomallei]
MWTLFHSYGFDFSVWEMWGALLHGGRLVIVPTEVTRTPSAFFALLCAEGVTVLNQTPSAFQALMSAQEEREEAALKADVDAEAEAAGNIERANVVAHRLRYVIFGGEALEPRTLASWYARHGERTQLVNMYGITETTVHVTYCALRAEDAMRLGASPIGVRIPDLQLYVLDDRREPVPMGVTGELYVGGAGVARGYLNRPELTRERFIDDPFVAGGRLYKTGDLARWRTDGSLEYLGRNDFQVKIRGFRIELGEIEAQLAKVTGVREVVVLARDSAAEVRDNATPNVPTPKSSSETEKRLVAYYTGDADVAALRAQAAQHLPSYMVPSAYVRLDAWPLTPNGKLDRRALPAPADDAYARAEYEAPQGAKEEALAAIWRELLHVERVSRHDNFFELGGHSLLAIGVIERMRREGLHTDVRSIFNAQTLSDLAARAQTDDRSIQAPPNLIPARATRITPDMLPLVALTQTQIDMLAVQVEGGAANIQDIYPLAPLQEGMVFHHLLHAESDAYMEAYFVGFRTRARLDRFLDALRMIVDRHDILRTGFFWEGLEQPVQIVQRRVRLPIEFVDLDPADGDVLRQLEARHDPRAHRLDIRRPALLSCHAAHDPAAGRWLLCVMAHHLAIDNTSLKLLVAEEQAIEQGGFDALPPAPSFRNFIAQIASGVDRREHEAFFSAMLGDIDSPTHPFGLQDVQGDGREIAEFQQRLSPELSKAIRVCTRRLGVSPASLMHLAWAMVLSRATGRREAVFGTVLFGRMQGGERGMGMFINTLPIRIDVDERYVAECLAHTHERVVQLIYHEHAPLALALRCSGLPARQALFSSLLNYRHSEQAARPPRDDDDIQYLDGNERTNYPLTVSIDDLGEAFSVTVQARHPASPERIRAFMETALEQLVRALDGTSGVAAPGVVMPRIAVCDIDVLPSEERHRLLVEWNDTAADYPQDQCLHRLFEAQAARHPDTIALIADGEPVGYAELNRRANRLARHLSARGLQPDQRVAICIDRGIDMVVAMLAVLKAGGAYVPLDPAYPSERLDYLLRDCAPVALLTHARLGASMQTRLVLALARLDTGCALIDLESDAGAWRHERDDDPPPSGLTPRHLAYVIYTSGSTGQPKGVMVEHRSVCNLVAWHAGAFDVGTGCRSASVAGVAFDATTWEVWAALCNGGCLSLAPGDAASDPQALLRWWRAQELDVGFLVTPLAELAYATGQSNAGMRTLLIGGDRLSRWPDSMPPGQMLVNNYGPTEATVVATSGRLQPGEATPPIGRPIANTRVYVLDAWLRPAPIGVAGELYIGGVQVARGYLNRPELTRERFIDDPFVAGGRLYKTGDLARWRTDGRLEYLGRNDFQVKIRGFRIELGEIEAQLAKVADVREVVVLARDSAAEVHDSATEHATPNAPSPSPETTTATAAATATATAIEKRLVAYYTGDADVVALRAQAAQHLPSYMVPSAYVRLDAWPLTPNGKLDRRALPAPADDAYARAEYEAPQGAKEEALAAIWRELLHVERVSRHDNFFELGGHSLLAVQLVSRLRQALSVEVALGTVFDAPVLSALAERLEAENTAVLPPIPLTPRDGRIALSLAQQRLWFLTQLEGVSEAYHMSGAVRLDGLLNREVLQRALNRIVMRHEALRTCFAREEGEPIQVIQPHADLTVSYHDLREAEQSEQRAKDLSQAHASAPFDLSRDLPVRVLLLQLEDEAHVVQVVMHHIASDGWSVGVFLQELSALYGSFIAEQGDPLAPLPLQYADYAAWQRRWLASGQLEKQGAFWQTNLSGAPTLLELPTDRPRPPKQSHAGASVEVKLGAALSERVKRLSQRHGVTPYMTLLSSWAAVLSRLSGQEEVVIGSPVAGRNRTEVGERTQLVNMYGITETTVHVTYCALRAEDAMRLGASPIGVRIPDLQLYVLDARREPVPMGVTGELYVGGAGVARGYLNRPELTRERFIDDPFVAGGRLYKTGDLARWRTDGSLEYLGRNDFQVKIRGFRIELGEIEAQLAKVTGVREVVVLARDSASAVHDSATEHAAPDALSPSPETSTATAAATATATATATEKRLVAYYTGDADVAALRAQAAQHLPSYMVPSAYVRLDAWPLTPNGKLDRRALPAPADDAYARAEYEAPQGAKEEALAEIWRDLLQVDRISRHDNFFQLGGHSLLAISLGDMMRERGLHADVRTLFNAETLAALAAQSGTDSIDVDVPPNLIPVGAARITPDMLPLVALTQAQIDAIAQQVDGGATNVQDIYPLAPLQEGMLFHHLLHTQGDLYLEPHLLAFRTRERLERFLSALQCVIDRHDVLRTGFFWEGVPQPVQVVWRRARLPVEYVELPDGHGDVASQLEARCDPRRHRIDIGRAPLVHCHVAHDARNDRWVLGVLTHHLVSDHTTLALLAEEAQAFEQGRGDALPPAVPFRNFVAHARLGTSEREHEAFFREMLGDVDEPTAPFGLLDVQGDGSAIVEHRRALAPGLSRSVRAHARRLGVSAASVMHVAWSLVLARTANRRDVVFGTVLFGRMQGGAHAHRTMGLFMNTLPVRIALDESDVETSLIATHDRLARLLRHEHAPLALAQRCSAVPAQAPLFTSLLNYRYSPHEEQGDATDDDVQFIAARERNNYPLTMIVDDTGEGFALTAQVDASIDAARVCAFMHTALEQLVRALDDARGAVLAELDVLPADEHRCVVSACNDTDAELPGVDFVDRRFEAQAARTPEAIAVACGAHALSYAALNRRANRLAHYLRAHGAGPERVVALALERSVDMMVGLLGILKSGSAYLPLDPAYPAERLAYIVDDARPALLLTEAALRDDWRDAGAPVVLLDADGPAIDACPDHNPDAAAGRDARTLSSLAYVIYTSGSTGRPKGVMIEHRNLANLLGAMGEQPGIGAHDVLLAVTSLSFDIAALELFLPLLHGARAVIAARDDAADPARLAHLIESSGASLMQATPSTWRMLAQHGWPRSARPLTLLCGGEALPPALAERLLAHVPAIWNLYGPTETTVWSTVRRVTTPVVDIGGPIANTQVYVLDERLRPAPIGVAGELYIGGAGVARGYLNRPELTRERFVDDPFRRGGRLYRTGDLARRRADGNLEYLGRNDFQVKIRGFRIELGEIEAQLAKAHGVQGVALAARDTPTADKRLVAYYVGDASAAALREHAAARLPAYMVPAAYVRLAAWPLTPNGKLDRAALPAPDDEAYARAEYEAPRGEHECKLAAIWRAVLQVERIGRHDDFFELGGHSLLAVRAVTAMRDAFGSDTSLRDLFARPVLKDLAEHASTAARARDAAIPKAARGEPVPMSFAQQRLWFLARMGGLGDAYHMPIAVRLHGALDVDALQRALSRIVSRHDALRTTFALEGEQPVQRVHADDGAGLRLRIDDLRGCADAGARRARILAGQASEPFDLARGPLVRGALVREADDVHTLCVTIHHIVSDGWSIDVFRRELSELYRAFAGGQPDPLPPLPVQYADYAAWQQRGIGGAALHAQAEYWRDALAGAPTLLELPTDRPRPPQPDYAGATVGLALDAPLTAGLRALARRHGATLFMTVFAAWSVLLSRLSRQTDVVIGTPSANRGHAQIEGLIGFFVNTIALRVDLDGAPTVAELLARVKARTLAAQQHQDIPFEHVVERVQPARSLSHSPVFQAMFAWQHASRGEMRLEGLRAEPLDDAARTIAKFDLTLSLRESGDAIDGGLEYASALFERATIERFAGYLRRLLEGMVADDTQRVDALPMLSRDERRDLIERRNATARPYPANSGVHRLFEAQAARTPDATAIVDGATTLDYRALDARANRIAHALAHAGVRAGDRVALHLEPSIGLVAAQLAVLKLGAAYVPVDVGNPPARKAFVAQDSGARLVLGDAALDWPAAAGVPQRDLAALLAGPWPSDAPARAPQCGGDTPAYVMYTSGSSGQPKGVLVTHRGIARLAVNSGYATFDASDRFAFASNPAFDASTFEVWTALLNGASIGIVKRDDLLDLGALAGKLSSIGVTCLFLTTALFNRCVSFDPAMFARLRCVISGGERADPAVYRKVMEAGPPRHLLNAYGPTETTTFAAVWEAEPRTLAAQAAPIGRPIGNTSVYVLDAYGAPVPVGVTGEIHIGGPGVAQGYLNRPALSAERFVRDPFVGGDARMYRTGDLGRWRPDGMLDCIGRADFQVKIRGFRIELGEIEACLLEHGALAQAAVLARDDGGDGGKTLVAYYVPRAGHEDGAPALRAHLAARLPEYMVPAAYVRLPAMPLTPNGKLERRALPAPDERSYVRRDYAAPQGEIETTLARIWAELFGIERVGRHDGFFELGGHSLLAVRMVARVHDVLGVEVPLRALFADPVLHVFASAVARASTRQASSNLVAFRSAGTAAPLFFIHSGLGEIGFVGDLLPGIAPEIPVYGFAAVGFLAGETPHATIEEMAAQYVDAMRRVQPHGPYRLAGWCAGGNIAFEMAHQLIAADETVEFLCMIDSPTSAPIDRSVTACVLARIPDDIPEALRTRLHALGDAFDVRGMLHACQAAGMLPIDLPTGLMERHVAVQYAIKHAKLNYVPPRLPVDVIHFVAQDEPMWRNGWAMDGWHDVADRVICLPASGDHMTMVAAPHAEQLGRRITEALAVHGGPRADGAERGYAPRIAIQTAPRDARAPTLFCIPGAGASVTTFSTLARHLPATFSVDGLQPRGLCGTMVPYLDVETAARAYLRSIRKAAPRGPYHLVGHSFGGWVAYEIACRLQEQGERVATLMLLDTERPGATDIVRGRKTRVDALAKLVELYEMHLGRPLGVSRDDLAALAHDAQIEHLRAALVRAKILPPSVHPNVLLGVVRVLEMNVNTPYRPAGLYAGTMHVVLIANAKADADLDAWRDEQAEQWRGLADDVRIVRAGGNHMTMLQPPHAASIAALLERTAGAPARLAQVH